MQWDPTLAMSIPELDDQHREILSHLELLIEAIRRGRSRDQVESTLAFLRRHVDSHFTAEEALMLATAYPDLPSHRAEHEAFVRDLQNLEMDYGCQGATPRLILHVSTHVTRWLREHMFRTDRTFASFLQTRSLSP